MAANVMISAVSLLASLQWTTQDVPDATGSGCHLLPFTTVTQMALVLIGADRRADIALPVEPDALHPAEASGVQEEPLKTEDGSLGPFHLSLLIY